jgi:hypothetical protein
MVVNKASRSLFPHKPQEGKSWVVLNNSASRTSMRIVGLGKCVASVLEWFDSVVKGKKCV